MTSDQFSKVLEIYFLARKTRIASNVAPKYVKIAQGQNESTKLS